MINYLFCGTGIIIFLFTGCSGNDLYLLKGWDEIKNKNYKNAITIFNKGMSEGAKDQDKFHYGIATCYYYLFDYDKSKTELQKVVSINKSYRDAYWMLARIYSKEGDLDKSIENYDKAILIEKSSMLLASRSFIFIRANDYKNALEDLNQAIIMDENNAYAFGNRGLVNIILQNYKEAKNDLERSRTIDPENPYVYKHFALYFLAQDDSVNACINLQQSKDKGYIDFGNEYDKFEVDSLLKIHCSK